jgi:hypothetical protein
MASRSCYHVCGTGKQTDPVDSFDIHVSNRFLTLSGSVVSQDPRLSSHEPDVNLLDTDPGQRHRHRHTRHRPGHMSTTLL